MQNFGKKGTGGVLLRVKTGAPNKKSSWSWERSPDNYFEDEVLLKGIRSDAEIISD